MRVLNIIWKGGFTKESNKNTLQERGTDLCYMGSGFTKESDLTRRVFLCSLGGEGFRNKEGGLSKRTKKEQRGTKKWRR